MSEYIGVVDIGSGYLKGLISYIEDIEGFESSDGEYLSYAKKESRGIEKGNIVKASAAKRSIREFLKLLSEVSNIELNELYILVSHPKIKYDNVRVELNLKEEYAFGDEEEGLVQIEERHLERLKELVREQTAEAGYEIIHIVPRYFELDGEKNYEPIGLHASNIVGYYHVIKLKKQVYLNLKNLIRSLNYEVRRIMFPAFVASYDILEDEDTKKNILIVDFGHTTTGYSFFEEGSPLISGALNIGLYDIAEAFALEYQLPVKKVFELFKEVGYTQPGENGEDNRFEVVLDDGSTVMLSRQEVAAFLIESVAMIWEDILKRLAEEKIDALDEVVLIGGGAKITNIKELFEDLLGEGLNCRVRVGKKRDVNLYGEDGKGEEYLEEDFAAVRGATALIKNIYAKGLLETSDGSSPFVLNEKKENNIIEETATVYPPLEEEKKEKKGIFGRFFDFIRGLFSTD